MQSCARVTLDRKASLYADTVGCHHRGQWTQAARTAQFSGLNAISHLCMLVASPLDLSTGVVGAERQSHPASHVLSTPEPTQLGCPAACTG